MNQIKHKLFWFGLWGSRITFSVIVAGIIHDLITGKRNDDGTIFRFNR
ncbi:hypothetical protein [Mucilaginibacter dorajii]|nr:hypothetical protein [Mucilaginibacter dorajii]MCS3736242.1 hypothetical protein [Mucilaginibacter dorajii]